MEGIEDFTVSIGETEIFLRIMQLENGLSVFISSSSQPRLGPIALASPPALGGSEPSSSSLFGMDQEAALVRTIAERIAVWSNQSCLVVISVKNLTRSLVMEILRSLNSHLLS
ncbi:MAG: proteasome assembly chaperone 4 family protein [Candidatus Thorarchaeota archaeon]|nr:proteasome assembly chaperone 4 family protein [Candidatus Thorarchaeota archaeon]